MAACGQTVLELLRVPYLDPGAARSRSVAGSQKKALSCTGQSLITPSKCAYTVTLFPHKRTPIPTRPHSYSNTSHGSSTFKAPQYPIVMVH